MHVCVTSDPNHLPPPSLYPQPPAPSLQPGPSLVPRGGAVSPDPKPNRSLRHNLLIFLESQKQLFTFHFNQEPQCSRVALGTDTRHI